MPRTRFVLTVLVAAAVLAVLAGACGGGGSASGSGGDPFANPTGAGGVPEAPIPGGTSYGFIDSSDVLPSWQERTLGVFVNAARMAPAQYRDRYMASKDGSHATIMQGASYPAVPPLSYSLGASVASRYHANDRTRSDCDTTVPNRHQSCNGTSFAARFDALDDITGLSWTAVAEVVTGQTYTINRDPKLAVDHWLCDGLEYSTSPPTFSDCPADTAGDGHRSILLNGGFNASGAGYAVTADAVTTWRGYWVMNPVATSLGALPPLVDGSHLALGSTLTFFLNFHDPGRDPLEVRLVLEDVPLAMTLDLGGADRGTYSVTATDPAGCAGYHFEALDADGQAWRYPASGELLTYGIGGCGEDYLP